MPSTSKSQQRLMGVAYSVKKGDMQIADVDVAYKDQVKELVDGMTLKQLKDFAETSHAGLPDRVEEAFKAGETYTWTGVEWDPKKKNNFKVSKKVEIVKVKPNGDLIGKAEGTSSEFIIRNPEKTLKKIKENITLGHIEGMGPIKLPTATETGSGDVPTGMGDAEKEYKKKRKKMKHVNTFESFINESKLNEEYIELPGLMEAADEMIEAFEEWYDNTESNWEDFKEDMAEDSVDEAAKNAQMEILAYLSNKMNDIIGDRKFKVRADFK